jgi:hypothetical protein
MKNLKLAITLAGVWLLAGPAMGQEQDIRRSAGSGGTSIGAGSMLVIGVTNAGSNFTSPWVSLSNLFLGIDVSYLVNSQGILPGGSIGFGDRQGIGWADGSLIMSLNNAHGLPPNGGALLLSTPGTIALVAGDHHQIGFSGQSPEYVLIQYDDPYAFGAIPSGYVPHSHALWFRSQCGTVELQGFGWDTNQLYLGGLAFYSGQPDIRGNGDTTGISKMSFAVITNGTYSPGRTVQRIAVGGAAGANTALDFNSPNGQDLMAGSATIALTTTNRISFPVAGPMPGTDIAMENKIFIIRAGLLPFTVTYPAWGTVTNFTLPGSVAAGQMLRLELEQVGPGETNVNVLRAEVRNDPTHVADSDAASFFTRSGVSNTTDKAAVNYLASRFKTFSLWTKMDAIYPMVGGGSTNDNRNLKANSFNITWNGTVTHNANGVTGNGSSGYGDTGFSPGSSGGVYTLNSCHFSWYSGSSAPTVGGTVMGVATTGLDRFYIQVGSFDWNGTGPHHTTGSTLDVNNLSEFRGFVMATRTSSTASAIFCPLNSATSTQPSINIPTDNVSVLARSFGGHDQFSDINLRFASIGSGLSAADYANMKMIVDTFEGILGRKAL